MVGRPALHSTLVAIVSVALLAGMTGCGSSDTSAGDERAQVESVVRRVLTHEDQAFCSSETTARFLNQNYGEHSDDPLRECKFQSVLPGDTTAHQVDFKSVRVEGDHAVLTVALTGGAGDGSVLRIELLNRDGRWKFDYFPDIQIDRRRFDAANRRGLLALGVTPREAACTVKRLHRFYDTDQLERAFVAGESDGYDAAEALCLGRGSLVEQLELGLRKGAPKDIPGEVVDCIGRRIAKGASTSLLRALFGAPDKLDAFIERAVIESAKACKRDEEAGLLPSAAPS